jgi:hypothetical protein
MRTYITGQIPRKGDKIRYIKKINDSGMALEIGCVYKVTDIRDGNPYDVYIKGPNWNASAKCFELIRHGRRQKMRVIKD